MSTRLDMSEYDLQDAIVQYARLRRWLVYHTYDSRHSAAGFPDLVLARRDRLIVVELKSATGRLRPEQLAWLSAFGAAHIETYVWRPADWPDAAKKALR